MSKEKNISSTKHIEKLAELLKLKDAVTSLVREVQATCLDDNVRGNVLDLCTLLELPKTKVILGKTFYFMKADAIAALELKQGIKWYIICRMWTITYGI